MNGAGDRASKRAACHASKGGCHRVSAIAQKPRGDGGTQRERTIRGDVRHLIDAEGHVDAKRKHGKHQSNGKRCNQKTHADAPIGTAQSEPRRNAVSVPSAFRNACNTERSGCSASSCPAAVISTVARGTGRYEATAA